MENCDTKTEQLWADLGPFLAELPRPSKIVVWADEKGTWEEREAIRLGKSLAAEFSTIAFEQRPQKPNYDFYPIFGVMGVEDEAELDFGVRIIGLPAGTQITSLVAAIQAVAFRGQQLELKTRIQVAKLPASIDFELVTDAQDDAGTVMASHCFNLAVVNKKVRTFLIMADSFPTVLYRHNVKHVPHLVINNNIHIEGVIDEGIILKQMAKAVNGA